MKRIAVGALSLTAAGLVALANFEGFRSEAYVPVPGDVPTIGFGSTTGVQMGDKISVPEALGRLQILLKKPFGVASRSHLHNMSLMSTAPLHTTSGNLRSADLRL